jgi:hypothetical protein
MKVALKLSFLNSNVHANVVGGDFIFKLCANILRKNVFRKLGQIFFFFLKFDRGKFIECTLICLGIIIQSYISEYKICII